MATSELKVLLIEDNPGDAFLMKFYLGESTSPSFNVSHAETVKAALDFLTQDSFDIILSDMNLPDSFGVDTIKTDAVGGSTLKIEDWHEGSSRMTRRC